MTSCWLRFIQPARQINNQTHGFTTTSWQFSLERANSEYSQYLPRETETRSIQIRIFGHYGGHFPNDEAAAKLIYLALRNITAKWKMPPVFWKSAMNQFAIRYPDRFAVLSVGTAY